MNSGIRISVIGAGLIGKRHIEIAKTLDCLESIVDPSEQAQSLANNLNVKHYSSINDMLSDGKTAGAIVATPTPMHMENTKLLVNAGIATLVEKPIADNLTEARRIVELADQKNVALMVGHHRRHNPLISAAKARIESGSIGSLVALHAVCWLYKPADYFDIPWRTQKGAGPLLTNLIHDIDLMRHFAGDVHSVQMSKSNHTRNHEIEDTAVLLLKFKNHTLATMSVSDTIVAPWSWELTANENPAYPHTEQSCYYIGGTHGSIAIPEMQHWHATDKRSWYEHISHSEIPTETEDPLATQIKHLCSVVEGTETPLVTGWDGLQTLEVLDAAGRASALGREVVI